jgi:NSS family neurotransmitter:Na+ symporter
MEAFAAGVCDKFAWSRRQVISTLCVLGALGSLLFTHQGGLFWLDIVDHFMNMYGLLVVCLLECIVIGWFYRTDKLSRHLLETSGIPHLVTTVWVFLIKFVCPTVLAILLAYSIHAEVKEPYGGYPVSAIVALGLLWVLVMLAVGVILSVVPWNRAAKREEA